MAGVGKEVAWIVTIMTDITAYDTTHCPHHAMFHANAVCQHTDLSKRCSRVHPKVFLDGLMTLENPFANKTIGVLYATTSPPSLSVGIATRLRFKSQAFVHL